MIEAAFLGTLIPLLLLLLILRHSRPIMSVFCWGLVAFVIAMHVNTWVGAALGLTNNPYQISVFVAPVVEEALKMLPLAYFLLFAPRSFVPYLYIFGMAIGIGFSIEENQLFVLRSTGDLHEQLLYVLLRSLSTCLMHALATGLIAHACTLVRRRGTMYLAAVPIAYGLAVFIHGFFNHLIVSEARTLAVIFPASIYIGIAIYLRVQEHRRASALSTTADTWSGKKPPDA